MKFKITEIESKSALHYHDSEFPTNWDLNIYRGCGHGCKYCFAQYSHKYLDTKNFFSEIFVKKNISNVFEKEIRAKKWKKDLIKICGITDCYQPIEEDFKIMPDILKTIKKYRNPIFVSTKSNLILRDLEIYAEIVKLTTVVIVTSVTTIDENIRKKIEPNASPTIDRIKMLNEFNKIGCKTGVLLMPIIPYLTDNYENIKNIFEITKENNIDGISCWELHLRGNTKSKFLDFIRLEFPEILEKLTRLYPNSYLSKEYAINIYTDVEKIRHLVKIPNIDIEKAKEIRQENVQLSLF